MPVTSRRDRSRGSSAGGSAERPIPLDLSLANRWWRLALIALTVFLVLVGSADLRSYHVSHRVLFWIYLAGHIIGVSAWIAWWWRGRSKWAAWAIFGTGAATFLPVVPQATALGFVTLFLGSGLLGLSGMFREALVASVIVGGAESILSVRLGEPAARSILSGGLAATLLVFLGGSGALLRGVQEARAVAVEREARIARANERLRASMSLERELVLAQERARSARELHDGLGHRLTLTSMSLQFALKMREKKPDLAWAEIDNAAQTNARALDVVRLWAVALDPAAGGGARGAASFEAIADAFRGTGLDVRVTHQGLVVDGGGEAGRADLLSGPAGVFLTRLVQEGLTNVLRHAHATRVDVDIAEEPGKVRIAIRDNGIGQREPREGFGLRSLRERAEALGGSLAGRPADPGWELTAVIPLRTSTTSAPTSLPLLS